MTDDEMLGVVQRVATLVENPADMIVALTGALLMIYMAQSSVAAKLEIVETLEKLVDTMAQNAGPRG